MSFRWRKSFSIAPGVRLNLSHRSARLGLGGDGITTSFHLFGRKSPARTTLSLPGTGLSYSIVHSRRKGRRRASPDARPSLPDDFEMPTLTGFDLHQYVMKSAETANFPVSVHSLGSEQPIVIKDVFSRAIRLWIEDKMPDCFERDEALAAVTRETEALTDEQAAELGKSLEIELPVQHQQIVQAQEVKAAEESAFGVWIIGCAFLVGAVYYFRRW